MRSGLRGSVILALLALGLAWWMPTAVALTPQPRVDPAPILTVFHGAGMASGNVRLSAKPGRLTASARFKRNTTALFKGRVRNLLLDQRYDEGRFYDQCRSAPVVTVSRYRSDGWAALSFVGIKFAPGAAPPRCQKDGSFWIILHLSRDLAHQQPGLRFRGVLSGSTDSTPACADLAGAGVPVELWAQPCVQNGQPVTYAGPTSPSARLGADQG